MRGRIEENAESILDSLVCVYVSQYVCVYFGFYRRLYYDHSAHYNKVIGTPFDMTMCWVLEVVLISCPSVW